MFLLIIFLLPIFYLLSPLSKVTAGVFHGEEAVKEFLRSQADRGPGDPGPPPRLLGVELH